MSFESDDSKGAPQVGKEESDQNDPVGWSMGGKKPEYFVN